MEFNLTVSAGIIALTWLIVQVIKPTKISNKYLPLVSVIIGICVALGFSYLMDKNTDLLEDGIVGVYSGWAASGLDDTASDSITSIASKFFGLFTGSGQSSSEDNSQTTSVETTATSLSSAVPASQAAAQESEISSSSTASSANSESSSSVSSLSASSSVLASQPQAPITNSTNETNEN